MSAWLWTHFAVEAGVIATAIKRAVSTRSCPMSSGSGRPFSRSAMRSRSWRRAVSPPARCRTFQMFFAPEREVAEGIRVPYASDRAARKIMERHTGREELQQIYHDVLDTGRKLRVAMPTLEPLEPFVDALSIQ
jgi:hypothetical protein